MEAEEQPVPETIICGRCAAACEPEDNFCRHCGLALRGMRELSVRESRPPAVWRPTLRGVVIRGAAVVAAGTLAELLARRLVRGAVGGLTRAVRLPGRRPLRAVVARDEAAAEDGEVVSDTVFLRRVRIRR